MTWSWTHLFLPVNLGNSSPLPGIRDCPLEGEAIVAAMVVEAEGVIPHCASPKTLMLWVHSPGSSKLRPKLRNWPSERRPTPLTSCYAASVDSGTLTLVPTLPPSVFGQSWHSRTPVRGPSRPATHVANHVAPSHSSTAIQTHPEPPHTATQVISAACTDTAVSTPFTSAPTSPDMAIDHSSDVAELIAEAKQMDLEAEAQRAGFSSTEEMFGRVLLACSLMMNALTLLVLLAAMNIQTAQAAQP
ncbi:hypothetical protein F4604DRAFT_1674569 [Suillus subluteus]|nr:hypothetical protein F4604DRAFT_1674569 [Suillus subluteus]